MTASYWESTQYLEWSVRKQERLLAKKCHGLDSASLRKLQLFYSHFLQRLGAHLALPQRVIASSLVYFHRFFSRSSYWDHDPWVMIPSCLFLSCKIEENVVQARLIVAGMHHLTYNSLIEWSYKEADITEAEFYLINSLNFFLICHHPYRPLVQFVADAKLECLIDEAWAVINDSYKLDMCLQYPPYIIAIAAILIAAGLNDRAVQASTWLGSLNLQIDLVWQATEELLDFYDFWFEFSLPSAFELARDFDERRSIDV